MVCPMLASVDLGLIHVCRFSYYMAKLAPDMTSFAEKLRPVKINHLYGDFDIIGTISHAVFSVCTRRVLCSARRPRLLALLIGA